MLFCLWQHERECFLKPARQRTTRSSVARQVWNGYVWMTRSVQIWQPVQIWHDSCITCTTLRVLQPLTALDANDIRHHYSGTAMAISLLHFTAFFQWEDNSIERGENLNKSGYVESFSHADGEIVGFVQLIAGSGMKRLLTLKMII